VVTVIWNINTKNCSLSIMLMATDQKPQKSLKRWYYPPSHWLNEIADQPFNDFSGFWSVSAVSIPQRNHLSKFCSPSVKALYDGGESNFFHSPWAFAVILTTLSHYHVSVWLLHYWEEHIIQIHCRLQSPGFLDFFSLLLIHQVA